MLGQRPVVALGGTWDANRKALEYGCAMRDAQLPKHDNIITRDERISSSKDSVEIGLRIYKAKNTPQSGEKVPVAVFYHGGGWALGTIAADESKQFLNGERSDGNKLTLVVWRMVVFCKKLVHETGHVVISAE